MRVVVLLVGVLLLGSPPSLAAQQEPAPSLATIAERYLAARGGKDRIRAVRSIIYHGAPRPDGRSRRWMAKARPYYWRIGEPGTDYAFAEGFDGSSWEFYRASGLVLRTSHAPAAAARHTAYFDDPLVYFGEPGWAFELKGTEQIGGRPTYWIRATYPDDFQRDIYVDRESWLVIANRWTAQVHAFGEPVRSETRISDYRSINGALFPLRFEEFDIATGKSLDEGRDPGWTSAEANVELPLNYFSSPPEPDVPLARMLNAVFASRQFVSDVMLWYTDFKTNPATRAIDTDAGVSAVGYQMLKNGAVEAAVALLEANARDNPSSARAHFGVGRAYRTAGREADAVLHFRRALELDPNHQGAIEALGDTR